MSVKHSAPRKFHFILAPAQPSLEQIEMAIVSERLRQARYSFNIALVASTASFFVSLIGAGLILSHKVSVGAVTAAGGLASSVQCVQLAKDANRRLDQIFRELNDNDKG